MSPSHGEQEMKRCPEPESPERCGGSRLLHKWDSTRNKWVPCPGCPDCKPETPGVGTATDSDRRAMRRAAERAIPNVQLYP